MIRLTQAVIVEGKYDKAKLSSLIDAVIVMTDGFDVFRNRDKLKFIRSLAEKSGIIILTDSDAAGFRIRSYLAGAIPAEQITHVYIPDVAGKERRKPAPSAEGKLGVEGISVKLLLEAFARAGITPLAEGALADANAAGNGQERRGRHDTCGAENAPMTSGEIGALGAGRAPNVNELSNVASSASAERSGADNPCDTGSALRNAPNADGTGGLDNPRDTASASVAGDTGASVPIDKSDLVAWGISGGQDSAEKRRKLLRSLDMPARMNSNALLKVLNSLYTRDEILRLTEKL